ncbi:MAG: hypothetical protein Q7K28_02485 [Candidatus Wildermuthbacteria bacterium]|nr:hypothetical protein [Candidatus Wildermuthbacteria bacterium]
MIKIKVICSFCGKVYSREKGRFNEAKKFDWKQYCSRKCQNQAKVTGVEKACANPNCRKKTYRELSQFTKSKFGNIFCSSSCAALFNNSSRRKIKICPICNTQFYGTRKYCSKLCHSRIVNPKKKSEFEKRRGILNKIGIFYNT